MIGIDGVLRLGVNAAAMKTTTLAKSRRDEFAQQFKQFRKVLRAKGVRGVKFRVVVRQGHGQIQIGGAPVNRFLAVSTLGKSM